jgi:hypothetical protein
MTISRMCLRTGILQEVATKSQKRPNYKYLGQITGLRLNRGGLSICAPSMGALLRVQVPSRAGHSE